VFEGLRLQRISCQSMFKHEEIHWKRGHLSNRGGHFEKWRSQRILGSSVGTKFVQQMSIDWSDNAAFSNRCLNGEVVKTDIYYGQTDSVVTSYRGPSCILSTDSVHCLEEGSVWEIHPPRTERFPKGGDFTPW